MRQYQIDRKLASPSSSGWLQQENTQKFKIQNKLNLWANLLSNVLKVNVLKVGGGTCTLLDKYSLQRLLRLESAATLLCRRYKGGQPPYRPVSCSKFLKDISGSVRMMNIYAMIIMPAAHRFVAAHLEHSFRSTLMIDYELLSTAGAGLHTSTTFPLVPRCIS